MLSAPGAEGYVTELAYTLGYYPELDPRVVSMRLAQLGYEPPPIRRACEPGFGQGLSLAIHAVAGDAEWWGNDLLPQHLDTLRSLTTGLTDRLHAYCEPFAAFCGRAELPQFDFIALHGVWSWVSSANRARLTDFIARRLAPQGVVYVSYNVRDTWAPVAPLRDFLVGYATRAELAQRPLAERIEAALAAAQAVVAADLPPARDNPAFERHLRAIRHQGKAYLAHEYFNRDWQCFDPADLAATFSPLNLRYAGQARALVAFASPPPFRRDLWVRGLARRMESPPAAGPIDPRGISMDRVAMGRVAMVRALNDRILQRALDDPYISTLASPVTGGGVEFDWRTLLALAAWRAGLHEAAAIATRVGEVLAARAQPFVHRGVVIRDAEEARRMLQREAEEFLEATLPRLRRLGIEAD